MEDDIQWLEANVLKELDKMRKNDWKEWWCEKGMKLSYITGNIDVGGTDVWRVQSYICRYMNNLFFIQCKILLLYSNKYAHIKRLIYQTNLIFLHKYNVIDFFLEMLFKISSNMKINYIYFIYFSLCTSLYNISQWRPDIIYTEFCLFFLA